MKLTKVYENSAVRSCVEWNAVPDNTGWDHNPDFHVGRLFTKKGIVALVLFNDDVAEAKIVYKGRLHTMTVKPFRLWKRNTRAGFVCQVKKWLKTFS